MMETKQNCRLPKEQKKISKSDPATQYVK